MKFDFTKQPGLKLFDRFEISETEPLISLVTAYYNAKTYFEQTYRSVLNQTFPYFEWIIVNDGSTNEDEFEFLENIKKTDSRIKLFHIENGGAAKARNFGVENTSTEIFIPVDADDLLEPTFVEYLYFALTCNPKATWVYTDSVAFGEQEYVWDRKFTSEIMKIENVANITSAINKKTFIEVGGYKSESKNLYEDWKLWLILLANNHFPIQIKRKLFWYRRLNSGALAAINGNEKLKKKVIKEIDGLAKKVPNGIKSITFDGTSNKLFEKPSKWDLNLKLKFKKEKTRILLLLPHMERGGADKFNLDIIENINKNEFEIGIITTLNSAGEWRQRFSEQVVDIFELAAFLDRNEWSAFIHYYITSRSVDIVMNISSYYGYTIMPWLRKEFPTVGLIDCVHAEGKYWRAGGYPRISATVDSILEKTFATNEYTRQVMINSYGKKQEKIETIYTGVDENYFCRKNISCDEVKEKLCIDKDRPVILFLCRISPEKRPFLMLEIADELRNKIPDICFLVVGNGPLLDDLKRAVDERNLEKTIYITGMQDDIRPYYVASDIALICSIKEGLAITTFEAMLMEVPVVSADVGGQKELVDDKTGRIVPCLQDEAKDFEAREYDAEEINFYTEAIGELLSNKENLKVIGKNCRNRILDGYTLNTMIKKIEDEFRRLKSGDGLNKRISLSNMLSMIPDVIDYSLTIDCAFETSEINSYKNWTNYNSYILNSVKLDQIEKLRSYRLILIYHNFAHNNPIGIILNKCIRFAWRTLRKILKNLRRK
jgi:glycosyltransferase involved in cell wall biosynthesis